MDASGAAGAVAEGSAISLPKGGGAIAGLGETFAADAQSGAGSFSLPLAIPAGRNDLAPKLVLSYSSGGGNGEFGLGWALNLPGVARKTSKGVPRFGTADTYLLSNAEDLVPVSGAHPGRIRFQPRTEGGFDRIEHVRDPTGDYWEVRGGDGTRSRYGTVRPQNPGPGWRDPAATRRPGPDPDSPVFGWKITETVDPLGNLIRYSYRRDHGTQDGHRWDQPLVDTIEYCDYGPRSAPSFLVGVRFAYEVRPDPFSDYRAGFEIRTTLRCRAISVFTRASDGVVRTSREYRLSYRQSPFNGVSLLTRVDVVGIEEHGGDGSQILGESDTVMLNLDETIVVNPSGRQEEFLQPLTFEYSDFDPSGRRFAAVTGDGLPTLFSDPNVALVDLRGNGLPDIVEVGGAHRFWANRGDGKFELPRPMTGAPPHALSDSGVRLIDATGDGRSDLLVTTADRAGYFPLSFSGRWSRASFTGYQQVPSVDLADPAVKLIDLDGDGLTDVLRSGSRLECWFNDRDPDKAWKRTAFVDGPRVDLADPHVRLADMTGDGLQDLVLLRNGNISYRPNLGHGRWGDPVRMRHAPRLPHDFDPRRLLLGDVDGDGAADLVYLDRGRIMLWGNRSGNDWAQQPVTISGTPNVVDRDDVRLIDLYGTGSGGLMWSRAADPARGGHVRFLDFCGGTKPYLLSTMDNHRGARTTVSYRPSIDYFLRDQADPATRWRTTLPFPVQVVASVEVADEISLGRLVTEYRYHHGYWDGVEREFRGFGMVEQLDTETFGQTGAHHSPPTLTKSWFHLGPVASVDADDWAELDLTHEYWPGDAPMLTRPQAFYTFLGGLSRQARRDALRTMRGQLLRGELYALDGTSRQDRPYTVTESLAGVREEAPPMPAQDGRLRIFFPFQMATRTTQWERGTDPMTQFAFTAGYDAYGQATQQIAVAVSRGRDPLRPDPAATQPYLTTFGTTEFIRRDEADRLMVNRVARASSFEVLNDGRMPVFELRDAVLAGTAELRVIGHSRSYFDGPEFVGLPLGQLGPYGLPTRSESLAFTDAFLAGLGETPAYLRADGPPAWPAAYPQEFRSLTPILAGYLHYGEDEIPGSPGGYYIVGSRNRHDIHDTARTPRGLVLATKDQLGAQSRIDYDAHDRFPIRTTDPVGLETVAVYDYRVLAASQVTDPNGNSTSVTFSPAGMVTGNYVRGKNGQGDVGAPSVRMEYDLHAFDERRQPVMVRSIRRVHHDTVLDVPTAERGQVIMSVEFSDGFGRSLQTRTQAEDVLFGDPSFGGNVLPVDQSAPIGPSVGRTRPLGAPENVVVSGWQVYDNKGRVVEKYEPFFGMGWDFAPPVDTQLGQKSTMFYDPRGQVIRTVNADGGEQRVLYGIPLNLTDPDNVTPTPWESFIYDANDNAGRTHGAAAQGYASHWNTPASTEVDALGRAVKVTARNGNQPATDWLVGRSTYDIQGNLLTVSDPLGREAFRYRVDLTKRRWRMESIDAGWRDTVFDGLGRVIEERDTKGALTLSAFDTAHRPIRMWARDNVSVPVSLRQRVEYGDGGAVTQPAAQRAAAREQNLLGRPVRHYDGAGLAAVTDVDFKGNILESARWLIADAPILATYAGAGTNGWTVPPFRVDWEPGPGQTRAQRDTELLEPVAYLTSTRYDALNRVTRQILPTDAEARRRELRPRYNRAGGLERVLLDDTVYVDRIAYDAKGQRTLVGYGNGVLTRHAYDPHTFRLARLRTERNGTILQDCGYDYDLAGHIITIRDRTPGCGLPVTPNALDRRFSYDPLYRLRSATGRESDSPPDGPPWTFALRGNDITKTRAYAETYSYDANGSLTRLAHVSSAGFTRDYSLDPANNRLHRMTVGTTPFDYAFDANGNLLSETSSRHFAWNHDDQLHTFATQTSGAEPSIHAHYLYDASGQRVKKLVRRQGGAIEVTHYLGGFEHHRWGSGVAAQNNQIHVMDGAARIALVRVGPAGPGDQTPAVAFQFADHVGSSAVTVDAAGAVISREEYTPFGETSFGSHARKRYRYTGKERDEESGLNYHGARYCLAWLARWASCDPIGVEGGINQYTYAANNPISNRDTTGKQPSSTQCGREVHRTREVGRPLKLADADKDGSLDGDETIAYYGLAGYKPDSPEDFARYVLELADLPSGAWWPSGYHVFFSLLVHVDEKLLEKVAIETGHPWAASLGQPKGSPRLEKAVSVVADIGELAFQAYFPLVHLAYKVLTADSPEDVLAAVAEALVDKLTPGPTPKTPTSKARAIGPRERALGVDPATKKYRPNEAETAVRVEEATGRTLSRADDASVDWIDDMGKTYDAVGNFPAKHFDSQWANLQGRIMDHLKKADFVPIDVSQFTAEQIAKVQQFIQGKGMSPRAFLVGH